jgi:muramidase (phage lysozyme)
MKLEFYDLDPEVQFNLALRKLNHYLPRAVETASRGRLSNTLNRRCAKWASRLGRAIFGMHPELRDSSAPPNSKDTGIVN